MNNLSHPLSGLTILSVSRRAGVNTLSLSDGSELSLPHGLFLKCPWRTGSPISPDVFHAWVTEHEYSSAMERAGHSLSAKSRSEKEMKDTLLRAGYSEMCVLKVIDRLRKLGYLNDSVYASSFARQRSTLGYGENRIRQELRMKGIKETDIQAAIEELNGDEQNETIRKAAEKAARGKDLSSFKDRQRVKAALARRGFDFESIDAVLSEMAGALDEDFE